MKQEWGPNQYTQDAYARTANGKVTDTSDENATNFCALGKIANVTGAFSDPMCGIIFEKIAYEVQELLMKKLREQGSVARSIRIDDESAIMSINDLPGGYDMIVDAIDAILLDNIPSAHDAQAIEQGELVPA